MPESKPRRIAEQYVEAWRKGDFDAQRRVLHDDLHFLGPFDTFKSADDFQAALKRLAPMLKNVEVHRGWDDGDDVCFVYDLVTEGPIARTPCAEWIQVRGDKIGSIRVFFDARPWAPMFEQQHS
jgi:ketosteroid isomerase-like protein